MRLTLFRYLLVELLVPFFVSLLVLTLVLLLAKTMQYMRLFFASGAVLVDFGKLLLYSLPYFLAFTMSMATLLSVLLAFARLSHDNEITAMKAAGISFYQMIPPVATLVGCAWLVSFGLTLFVLPGGQSALERHLLEMAQSRVQLGLKERVFNDQIDGLVFFINSISPDGTQLKEVFISDERSPETKSSIVADEGIVINDPSSKRLTLRLFRGNILRVRDDMRRAQTIHFQNYDFHVDLDSLTSGGETFRKGPSEMSLTELREAMATAEPGSKVKIKLSWEWHQRFSLPFACIVLGFVAAPLGVQTRTGSRFSGVVIGLFLFLLYYIFLSAAQAFRKDVAYPPAIGLWVPNVVFGILAITLWIKTAREQSFKPIALARRLAAQITSRLTSRHRPNRFKNNKG